MVNSVWFRLAGGLDIEEWADPEDDECFARMSARGAAQLSTNHLCGTGYWVWMIPLSSGPISIGIVADPRFHPLTDQHAGHGDRVVRGHEPQLAQALEGRRDQVEDFLKVEDFAMARAPFFGRALVPGR